MSESVAAMEWDELTSDEAAACVRLEVSLKESKGLNQRATIRGCTDLACARGVGWSRGRHERSGG